MLASSLLTVLAAGVTMVAAQYPTSDDSTTTSTMTMTQTLTITKCKPTNADCPSYPTASSESAIYPVYNTTSTYCATDSPTTLVYPTATYGETSVAAVTPTYKPTTTPVVTSGAGNLVAQSGLLLGVVAAGVALLA